MNTNAIILAVGTKVEVSRHKLIGEVIGYNPKNQCHKLKITDPLKEDEEPYEISQPYHRLKVLEEEVIPETVENPEDEADIDLALGEQGDSPEEVSE